MTTLNRTIDSRPKKSSYQLLAKLDKLTLNNTMDFLDDTDLSNLAVNKLMAHEIQQENRWKNRLQQALFRGIYQQNLLNKIAEGKSIVKETKEEHEESLEFYVKSEITKIFQTLKQRKITNFQEIYARLKKLGDTILNEDEIILLSGNVPATTLWLEKNRDKIKRQEFLDLKGFCPLHYIALTGNVELMRLYPKFGDIKVKTLRSDGAEMMAAISGNAAAIAVCAKEYKLNMHRVNFFRWDIQCGAAFSGNLTALHACASTYKMIPNPMIPALAAKHGNEEMLFFCNDILEMPLTKLIVDGESIHYIAASAGNKETVDACDLLDADSVTVCTDVSLLEAAASSGKVTALKTCEALIYDISKANSNIGYYAGSSGKIAMLRYFRDKKINLTGEYKLLEGSVSESLHHLVAEKGGVTEMKFCTDIGLEIKNPNGSGQNILHIAAQKGNSTLLRSHEQLNLDIRALSTSNKSVLHHAIMGNDAFTLLSCLELGFDINAPSTHGYEDHIQDDCDPAMLITLKLLNIPISLALEDMSQKSQNLITRMFACILSYTYTQRLSVEWDKSSSISNMATRISHFFNHLYKLTQKEAGSFFQKKFIKGTKERKLLNQLAVNLSSMQDKNLVDLYVYLTYSLLRGVTTHSLSDLLDSHNPVIACVLFASEQVLGKIHAKKAELKEEHKMASP